MALVLLLAAGFDARAGSGRLEVDGRRREPSWVPVLFLFVLLGSILVSGLMAIVEMMRTRRVRETFRNMVCWSGVSFRSDCALIRKSRWITRELLKLPFGVAVAISTRDVFLRPLGLVNASKQVETRQGD